MWLVLRTTSGYVVRCYGGHAQIAASHQPAAALWLGHVRVADDGAPETTEPGVRCEGPASSTERAPELTGSMRAPAPYAVAEGKGGYVPVYNLRTLLGEEHIARLRKCHEIYWGELVVLKKKNATLVAQMRLWQLMGYLAKTMDYD